MHLLDQSEIDFAEELRVGKLKHSVIMDIKNNTLLEADLNLMDIKIGLLVKNRIELQDVVTQSKILKAQQRRGEAATTAGKDKSGLKAMDRQAHKRLKSFQHLFYLLQTNPEYLAALVFVEQPLKKWSAVKNQR